ncbi:MAG: chloride channel protein [Verrucomicrobia bacterium]|nr:chloride channel protein [Verrucomicrobiota bacterium]
MLLLVAFALPLGIISALVAKALLWLIAEITNVVFFGRFSSQMETLQHHHLGAWVILVPVIGGLIIGVMARYGSEKIRGHGIPEAIEAILLGGSLISPKVAILKPISSAISIGTGGPFGAEGPIIMTGGAFGSLLAQLFHLTAAERKTLLVAGAAGGMAAVFATPIAATLLAVELLLFEWRPRSFVPVVAASMTAYLCRIPLLGPAPIFPIALHHQLGLWPVIAAGGIGIIAGLGSGLLTQIVYFFEDAFAKLPLHWMWWPAIGAVFVGIGGWIDPRVLGVGYYLIHGLLRSEIIGPALLGLVIGKALVWAIALGSGTSGGVLAPLLIIGGSLGALIGQWLPFGDIGLWAMIGMAAMMGGTMRSPLTGIFFLLELTHDLNALPLLLCGSVAALAVTVLLLKRSILTEKLARRGQHIAREYSVDLFEMMRVSDVMDPDVPLIPANTPLPRFSARIASGDPLVCTRQGTLLGNDQGELVGIITRGDVVRAFDHSRDESLTVANAGSTKLIVAYPDETLHDAMARMLHHDIGRLPVVERGNEKKAVGYLGRASILVARQRYHREEEFRSRGFARHHPAEVSA